MDSFMKHCLCCDWHGLTTDFTEMFGDTTGYTEKTCPNCGAAYAFVFDVYGVRSLRRLTEIHTADPAVMEDIITMDEQASVVLDA